MAEDAVWTAGSELHLVAAPELGLSAEELAAAWNASPQARALAQARVDEQPSAQFGPEVASVLLSVGTSLALGLVGDILYDLLTSKWGKPGAPKEIELAHVELGGGVYLVIKKREE